MRHDPAELARMDRAIEAGALADRMFARVCMDLGILRADALAAPLLIIGMHQEQARGSA